MGMFSKSCEYALRAVFYIASNTLKGERVGIKQIAENINSPEAFLGKILQQLTRAGIVQSMKGPNGGFFMLPEQLKRPLADVVAVVDGNQIFVGCGLGLTYCSETNPCPLHNEFKKVRNELSYMLHNTQIGEFNEQLLTGKSTLNK
ncbi:Rrf2 family transcriptional regulator [Sphingobacteriaceae bacterium WQ 2009]|uniref:Rrf2 family transcriptional regulator n=1 Tax=Rhinopithecimicrobium faecis TaxID=2820698 RepID=A0A8T4H9E4_9SPHI|nr:Rrf2 family transcriptional regulator [Sphingobacteriaceae bacterium WQ 2009]